MVPPAIVRQPPLGHTRAVGFPSIRCIQECLFPDTPWDWIYLLTLSPETTPMQVNMPVPWSVWGMVNVQKVPFSLVV